MKVITVSGAASTPGMIKGIFHARVAHDVDCIHAHNREELLAALDEHSVVLVDCERDAAECAECVAAAKAKIPGVPVLILCSRKNAGYAFAGLKAGAAGVVNKPFDPDDVIRSITAAVRKNRQTRPGVNVEFINPFIDATHNVFSSMCRMEIARKSVSLGDDYRTTGDIAGIMRLSGDASGTVAISLSAELACLVAGNMLGEPPAKEPTREVLDAVGEIINMIAGQAKTSLVKTKYHFTISIPEVVVGPGHAMEHQPGAPIIVVLFEGAGHVFSLQVCLTAGGGEAAIPQTPAGGKDKTSQTV